VTAWPSALAGLLLVVAGAPVAPRAETGPAPSTRLFAFADDDIFESSGLVDRGSTVYTVDDSGSDPVLYGVDPTTGRTVSRTTYAGSATDAEALAPGSHGTVWVGDTGDNRGNRDDVQVYRVRPLDGDHPGDRFALRYPDGAHDAETLLVQPRTERVFVVTKSPFGGTVFAAPRRLPGGNAVTTLRPFARVGGLVTDGTFLPDGRHVLLRTYGDATLYTFPGFEEVGSVRLPAQPQGEGISVTSSRVLVSSEGVHADVLQVRLPRSMTHPAGAVPTRRATPPPLRPAEHREPRDARDWGVIALLGVLLAGAGWLSLRGPRRRGRRTP
jgi:hypothetical protein